MAMTKEQGEQRYKGTEAELALAIRGFRVERAAELFMSVQRYLRKGGNVSDDFNVVGARDYLDRGWHPEYATPECINAANIVTHELLGEESQVQVFEDMYRQNSILEGREGTLSKKNVAHNAVENPDPKALEIMFYEKERDIVGQQTWGTHENYQLSREAIGPRTKPRFWQSVTAHLITRLPLTGAGGFIGATYWLSPRAFFHSEVVSSQTTDYRGIFNSRDEALVNDTLKWLRLHVITSEGNMSPWQIHIKVGAMALVCKALENEVYFDDLYPNGSNKTVVGVFHAIAKDMTLNTVSFKTKSGTRHTALSAQRAILERVKAFAKTDDELLVIDEWEQALNELEKLAQGEKASRFLLSLDWYAKWRCMQKENSRGNTVSPQDVDIRYAQLIDHNGRRGIGHTLRVNGLFRLTPENWSTDGRAFLQTAWRAPSSLRAQMRGAATQHKRYAKERQGKWNTFKINDQFVWLPDWPTQQQAAEFMEELKKPQAFMPKNPREAKL